jgi:hypothetical protein
MSASLSVCAQRSVKMQLHFVACQLCTVLNGGREGGGREVGVFQAELRLLCR